MSKQASATRGIKRATSAQLRFASNLGLEVNSNMPGWQVGKMISAEVRKRGKKVLKDRQPRQYDLVQHPRHGLCEVVTVHEKSLRITLEPIDGGKKFVVSAMNFGDYPSALN